MPGRVYIRSKIFFRCTKDVNGAKFVKPPDPEGSLNPHVVNVTSSQGVSAEYRLAFSPMHIDPNHPYLAPNGVTYPCFEHYWQELKHFPGRDREKDKAWWRRRGIKKANRKLPKVVPSTCLYSADEVRFPGQTFQYVESRKTFYVPDYSAMLEGSLRALNALGELRAKLEAGTDIIVEDFDGPRGDLRHPQIAEVTPQLLRDKINDTAYPFGHGYIVAAKILRIPESVYA